MKFTLTSTLFFAGTIAIIFFFRDSNLLFPLIGGVFLLYIAIIAVASFSFRLNFFLEAIHQGTPGKIVLTFDDGPHPETTEKILEILNTHHVQATFFLIGHKAASQPGMVKKMMEGGHEVANHSYHHSYFHGFLPASSVTEEIEKTNSTLQKITGKAPIYYRPPYGVTNPNIARAVKKAGMTTICWDGRSLDTVISDRKRLLNRVKKTIPASTILLLHDSMPVTVSILPEILDFCKNNGIEIVPLSQTLKNTR